MKSIIVKPKYIYQNSQMKFANVQCMYICSEDYRKRIKIDDINVLQYCLQFPYPIFQVKEHDVFHYVQFSDDVACVSL